MNSPCSHECLQEGGPCKLHEAAPNGEPLCCWTRCADCGGMFHMVRVFEDEITDLMEIRKLEDREPC